MTEIMTTRLTHELERGLTLVAKTEKLDKSTALRRLLGDSLEKWKKERAIKLYVEGVFSAEQAAHFADLGLWSFFALLNDKKITVSYDKEELEKDFRVLQWKKQ